jgi:2-polyprenyl-3-methyl-5-hydroxy-6-metoxy-1,4-benzoquinol methylase
MVDYEKLWSTAKYREEKGRTYLYCDIFLAFRNYVMDCTNALDIGVKDTVIDWGCGKGIHAIEFSDRGMDVVGLVDIASNCMNEETASIFEDVFEANHIKDAIPAPASFSYCADVLEHVEEEDVNASILNIVRHTLVPGFMFFNIATKNDEWNGQELHVTIKPQRWWMDRLIELIPGMCIFTGNMSNNALTTFWHLA